MGKRDFAKEPQIIAAIISVVGTLIGTLLISILLGFLEGRIGLGSAAGIIAFLVLLSIWVLLAFRWGVRLAVAAAAVMIIIGSVIFLAVISTRVIPIDILRRISIFGGPTATPTPTPTATPTSTSTSTPTLVPSLTATPTLAPSATPTATPSPEIALLYSDGFSDPSSGWSVSSGEDAEKGYSDGEYYILINKTRMDAWGRPGRYFTDFRLEVDARKVAGPDDNDFGVIVRYRDGDNFYVFKITSDGYYKVWKEVDGEAETLVDWHTSPHINQGQSSNHLTLIAQGSRFSFSVNNEHLVDVVDSSFTGGDIGFIAGAFDEAGVEIHFDDLEVWALP